MTVVGNHGMAKKAQMETRYAREERWTIMNRRLALAALCVLAATAVSGQASGAVTGNIPKAAFDVLGGVVTDSIIVSGVTDNGVTADLTFTFTAQAPGHTDTPALAFGENTRLGVNSSFNQGQSQSCSALVLHHGVIESARAVFVGRRE